MNDKTELRLEQWDAEFNASFVTERTRSTQQWPSDDLGVTSASVSNEFLMN